MSMTFKPLYLHLLVFREVVKFVVHDNFAVVDCSTDFSLPGFACFSNSPFGVFNGGVNGLSYLPGLALSGDFIQVASGLSFDWVLLVTDSPQFPDFTILEHAP